MGPAGELDSQFPLPCQLVQASPASGLSKIQLAQPWLGLRSEQDREGNSRTSVSVFIVLWQCKARLGTLAVFSQLPHCHRHHSPIIPEKPLPKSLPECLPSELCVKTGCNCSKVLPYMCSCEKHEEVLCPGV